MFPKVDSFKCCMDMEADIVKKQCGYLKAKILPLLYLKNQVKNYIQFAHNFKQNFEHSLTYKKDQWLYILKINS